VNSVRSAVLAIVGLLLVPAPAAGHDDVEEQIAELTAAILRVGAAPGGAALVLERGGLYLRHRDFAEALADFDRALALDPSLAPRAHAGRARALLELAEPSRALQALEHADPADGATWSLRGSALERLDRPLDAAEAYDRSFRLTPQPAPDLVLSRARCLVRAGRAAAALASVDEGLAVIGPCIALEIEAIGIEAELGRYDAALARIDRVQAAAANARSGPWDVRRAAILARAGRVEEARAVLAAARATLAPRRSGDRALLQEIEAALAALPEGP
jgi:tetratricopeptide (TPR) repeat protein